MACKEFVVGMGRIIPLCILFLICLPWVHGFRLDSITGSNDRAVQDSDLHHILQTSVEWLQFRSIYLDYPLLDQYAQQLQRVLRPSCQHCFDYFEAVAVVKSMGKVISQILKDGKEDVHYAVVRRSYVAAVWVLQRSRMFVWETSHLNSNVLSTMFRLYSHHVSRTKGRAVSFHHISKCGGTTMCQLAASNRCSNPFLNQEKNCVLSSRLDGPIWLVAHDITPTGAEVNLTRGALDVDLPPDSSTSNSRYLYSRRYATEPRLPMWLMYSCPYVPNGRLYSCRARSAHVQESGTTFMANERTLSKEYGVSQVCPEFLNAVILREPIPHVISLMAEVKYRYVRQLQFRHHVTTWQPPSWNLTWWETFGPALVGNYATRTLLGRDSFCRSARNMTSLQLAEALDSLLSFDVVMTLGRSADIDLMISTMMGWPAQNFTSQPKARVRDITTATAGGDGQPSYDNNGFFKRAVVSFLPDSSSTTGSSGGSSQLGGQGLGSSSSGSGDSDDGVSGGGDGRNGVEGGRGTAGDDDEGAAGAAMPEPGSGNDAAGVSTGSDYNDKQDDGYADSHYDDIDSSGRPGGNRDGGAYSERRGGGGGDGARGAYSDDLRPGDGGAYSEDNDDNDGGGGRGAGTGQASSGTQDDDDNNNNNGGWWAANGGSGGSNSEPDDPDSDDMFERAAAALDIPFEEPPPPPAVPPEVLAAAGAVSLVRSSWLEREALMLGYPNVSSAGFALPEPVVEHTQSKDVYGGHLVRVSRGPPVATTTTTTSNNNNGGADSDNNNGGAAGASSSSSSSSPAAAAAASWEVWHAFPRHAFAFTDADMAHLESLTQLDGQLVATADVLLDLDIAWLRFLLHNHHYRKKMKSVASTYTACGFAGMMPLTETTQAHIFR